MSAILDHFGYPPPHLDQWQQRIWYDLGAAQELLHQTCSHLAQGLPAVASPPRAESSPSSTEPAATPIRPSYGGKFIKALKGGSSAPRAATAGPSSTTATTSPRMEIKKKKRKTVKHTVTSETVCPPEMKRKLISESPDSQVEGPFHDSEHTESALENSSHTP